MTFEMTPDQEKRWARPLLEETGPVRSAGGFFRTAEGNSMNLGGVPLVAAEDAVVAAVRMAYKVADTQVQRSARLAERLRKAGDRAVGERSDRKAVDASEQLLFRAMMSALAWLEAAAAERDSPIKRAMAAQYRLIGSLLGVTPPDSAASRATNSSPPERGAHAEASGAVETVGSYIPLRRVRVFLRGEIKRPVVVRRCEVASVARFETALHFYKVERVEGAPLEAAFAIDDDGKATLTIATDRSAPSGAWKAAICSEDGEQIGLIEIEL